MDLATSMKAPVLSKSAELTRLAAATLLFCLGCSTVEAIEPPLSPGFRWGGCNRSAAEMDGA